MSIFTMLNDVPQVWIIWIGHQAAGVSLLSWGAYLLSALLWFWTGCAKATGISTSLAWGGSAWSRGDHRIVIYG